MQKSNFLILSDLHKTAPVAINVGLSWSEKLGASPIIGVVHDHANLKNYKLLYPEYEDRFKELASSVEHSIDDKIEQQFKQFKDDHSGLTTMKVGGNTTKHILAAVEKCKAKILIIPMHSTLDEDYWFASLSEKLIRVCPIPVLIVKDDRALNPTSISFPFAFQGLSEDAATWVDLVAQSFQAKVTAMHTLDHSDKFNADDMDALDTILGKEKNFEKMKQIISNLMCLGKGNKTIIESAPHLNDKEHLLQLITDNGHDLIIMGSSGKGSLERLYLGSFCEFLLRNAPSSLLITKKFIN